MNNHDKPSTDEFTGWIAVIAETDGVLVSTDGSVRWTAKGQDRMRHQFAAVGVDIRCIKTLEQYVEARRKLSPLLPGEMMRIARGSGPVSTQRRVLMRIVAGLVTSKN